MIYQTKEQRIINRHIKVNEEDIVNEMNDISNELIEKRKYPLGIIEKLVACKAILISLDQDGDMTDKLLKKFDEDTLSDAMKVAKDIEVYASKKHK